jgi:hypothetical protein
MNGCARMTKGYRSIGTACRRLAWPALAIALLFLLLPAGAARAEDGIGPDYVRLTPISFSVIGDDDKIDKEVSVFLALELKSGVKEAQLNPYTMRLQDSLLVALTQLWDSRPVRGPQIPATEIKQTLLPVVTGVTGPNKVAQILILGIGERIRN